MSNIFAHIFKSFLSGNDRSVTVKKNAVGALLVRGVSIVVSLMLVPMTLGYVSSELYGIWLMLSSIILWLHFFDVGFTLGLKNRLAEAIAKEDWQRAKSLVSTTYAMITLIMVPLCVLLELIVPMINWAKFLNVSTEYNPEIIKALYVLVVCLGLYMIFHVITAVAAAYQRVALSTAFTVIGNALSLLVIFILTKTVQPSLFVLSFAISGMPIVVLSVASIILYKRGFKAVTPSVRTIDRKKVRDLFGLGVKFFFIQIQVIVLFQATNILISNVSSANDVTAYNIAYKYLNVAMMVYTIILAPLWPAFTDAYTKRDFGWMKLIYKKMNNVYALSAFVMVLMLLASPLAYHLWIGERAEIPFVMTLVVCIYMMLHTWDSLQVMLLNGIGAVKLQMYVTLVGLVVHIPLALFLGHYIGAIGVVCSMSIVVGFYLTFFTIQINKILNRKATGIWIA